MKQSFTPESQPVVGPYSAVVKSKSNYTIYVSGSAAVDSKGNVIGKGDLEVQVRKTFDNIKECLEAAGATMDDVVKLNFYARNIQDYARISAIRKEYFQHPYPASTLVEVSNLLYSDLQIEIEAIAAIN